MVVLRPEELCALKREVASAQPIAGLVGGLCDGRCDLAVPPGPKLDRLLSPACRSWLGWFHVSSLCAGRFLHSQLVSHKPTAQSGWVSALEVSAHTHFLAGVCLPDPEGSLEIQGQEGAGDCPDAARTQTWPVCFLVKCKVISKGHVATTSLFSMAVTLFMFQIHSLVSYFIESYDKP